jgi:hypothetical protein
MSGFWLQAPGMAPAKAGDNARFALLKTKLWPIWHP